jgi:hypothetical protein
VVGLAAAALLAVAAVDLVADATQTRPDRPIPGSSTRLEVHLGYSSYDQRSTLGAAIALQEACRTTIPERTAFAEPQVLEGRLVALVTHPALGEHEIRRFRGCLEDATLDRIRAEVRSVTRLPADR